MYYVMYLLYTYIIFTRLSFLCIQKTAWFSTCVIIRIRPVWKVNY